ncbi:hypothetical protein PR048_020336 [Dryococelus australis]|uniref:Uncharacterized protein n=1 Tax=Dryococelus australis TaxID=614101 RepID=A0ABQ9H6E1_9NEOP|nr:hypothetical protein PR048_020336 [Dryococelus australis]
MKLRLFTENCAIPKAKDPSNERIKIYHSGIKRTPYEALFGIPQKNGLLDSCLPSDIAENIGTEEQLSNLTQNFDETDTENVDEANM